MNPTAKKVALVVLAASLLVVGGVGLVSVTTDIVDAPGTSVLSSVAQAMGFTTHEGTIDTVENTWAGGGAKVLFDDDMSHEMAHHMDNAPYPEEDYYGGAVPTNDDGAKRWQHEDFRWGTEVLRGDETWDITHEPFEGIAGIEGAWQLGNGSSVDEATYPARTVAGVVSPVIDLSSVAPLEADVEGDTGINNLVVAQEVGNINQEIREGDDVYQNVTDEGAFEESVDRVPMNLATAALELSHAYEFDAEGDSGGRVEVSVKNPLEGWTDWQGVYPSHQRLVISEEGIRARGQTPGTQEIGLPVQEGNLLVSQPIPDSDDSQFNITPFGFIAHPPTLYGGEVEASSAAPGGPWDGFVGSSGGQDALGASLPPQEIVSVFDLSSFAGHEIKLRFIVATTGTTGFEDGNQEHEGLGWLLNHTRVHAAGEESVDVLGMPSPGDGTVVDGSVAPIVAIQNTANEAQTVDVEWTLTHKGTVETARETTQEEITLDPGPTGRQTITSPLATDSFPGLHEIKVRVTDSQLSWAETQEQLEHDVDVFYVLNGQGGDLRVHDVRVHPIDEGEPDEHPTPVLLRGQQAQIQVDAENLAPTPKNGDELKVEPVLLDNLGQEVGHVEGASENKDVTLPVSRTTSGALGTPDPLRTLNWTWQAPERVQTLELLIRAEDGETLYEAGKVFVEDQPPDSLDLDFGNLDRFEGSCERFQQAEGRGGVAVCAGANDNRDRQVKTSRAPVTDARLEIGGPHIDVTLVHKGDVNATVWFNESRDPDGFPPGFSSGWEEVGNATFTGDSEGWDTSRVPVLDASQERADLKGQTGWVYLELAPTTENPVLVDTVEAHLVPEPDDEDEATGFELMRRSFQGAVHPQKTLLEDPGNGQVIYLTGVDEWAQGTPVEELQTETPKGTLAVPTGRLAEDAVIPVLNQDPNEDGHRLDGVRPTLSFQHFHDLGPGGVAVVEVRPTEGSSRVADRVDRVQGAMDGPLSAGHHAPESVDGWHPVAVFEGRTIGDRMQLVHAPLDAFSGQTVEIQLRYHLDHDLDLSSIPLGWVVGDFKLSVQAEQGPETLYEGLPGEEEIKGGSYVEKVDATRAGEDATPWPRMNPPSVKQKEDVVDGIPGPSLRDSNPKDRGFSLVTEPVDLKGSDQPVFTIDQNLLVVHPTIRPGGWSLASEDNGRDNAPQHVCQVAMVGLEYRVLEEDGSWPTEWTPAIEHEPETLSADPGDGATVNLWDPHGEIPSPPFEYTASMPNGPNDPPTVGTRTPFENHDGEVEFSLAPLADETVQFRIMLWKQHPTASNAEADCDIPRFSGDRPFMEEHGEWNIKSLHIGEARPIVDAAIGEDGIRFHTNDLELVQQAGARVPGSDPVIFGGDTVFVSVNVTNQGMVPVDAEAGFTVTHDERNASLSVQAAEAGQPTQTVHLEPEETREVVFEVSVADEEHVPGSYTAHATISPLDAQDRIPETNEARQAVEVMPVRNLNLDVATSGVTPPVAGAHDARTVTATLANDGNVDEADVTVEGHLVAFEGFNTVPHPSNDPLELEPQQAATKNFSLPKRGDGVAELEWTFPAEDMINASLEPGEDYAFEITITPESDSFEPWWNTTDESKAWPEDPKDQDDYTLLLRFTAEHELYRTDLSPKGVDGDKVSGLDAFPVDVDVEQAWTTRTLVDGEPLQEDLPVPEWELVDTETMDLGFKGTPSGQAWMVDAYDGFEDVQHVLESPVIPYHVVRGTSNAILDLTYASTAKPGQVTVETRTLEGGEWSPWHPLGQGASERVAIILPPDFPHVTGSEYTHPSLTGHDLNGNGYEQLEDDWAPPHADGHPRPPFYSDPGDHPDITPEESECVPSEMNTASVPVGLTGSSDFCPWTPFPSGQATYDQEWVEALNEALSLLVDELGPENVGLFTLTDGDGNLNENFFDDPGMDSPVSVSADDDPTLPRYQLPDEALPIESLDALVERLGSYGAIAMVGDNTTKTLIHETQMGDWDYVGQNTTLDEAKEEANEGTYLGPGAYSPDADGQAYHAVLSATLEHAPARGVDTLAAMGPAVAALAQSGLAQGAAVTTPHDGTPWARCTDGSKGHKVQPLPACETQTSTDGLSSSTVVDTSNDQNYAYYRSDEAQNLAVNDLVRQSASRTHRDVHVDTADTGLDIVTAYEHQHSQAWAQALLESLPEATGHLPEGDWRTLPRTFISPLGGTFDRNDTGHQVFDGRPTQLRVIVDADLQEPGHGLFAVERLDAFGTPRKRGALGVSLAHPQDGATYDPDDELWIDVDLENRGVEALSSRDSAVRVTVEAQSPNCQDRSDTVDLDLTLLKPGEIVTERIDEEFFGNDGLHTCPNVANAWDEEVQVNVTAEVVLNAIRAENVGHTAEVSFMVQRVDRVALEQVTVTPKQVEFDKGEEATIRIDLDNVGTTLRHPDVRVLLEPARPWLCVDPGGSSDLPEIAGCTYEEDPEQEGLPLADATVFEREVDPVKVPVLDAGETGVVEAVVSPDEVPPGIYHAIVEVETRTSDPDEDPVKDTDRTRLFLAHEDVPFDEGRASLDARMSFGEQVWQGTAFGLSDHGDLQGQHAMDGGGSQNHAAFHTHNGSYAPDPETRSGQAMDTALEHGWRVCKECDEEAFEWRRASEPSWEGGRVGFRSHSQDTSQPPQDSSLWELGHADFGPDGIVWPVLDAQDPREGNPGPYATLASFEDPTLALEARWQATQNTGYVVQMQLPQLGGCQDVKPTGTLWNCAYWDWSTPWLTLHGSHTEPSPAGLGPYASHAVETGGPGGATVTESWMVREPDSNPLAGPAGFEIGLPDGSPHYTRTWGPCQFQDGQGQTVTVSCFPGNTLESDHEGLWGGESQQAGPGAWRTMTFDLSPGSQGAFTEGQRAEASSGYPSSPHANWEFDWPEDRLMAYCQQIALRYPNNQGDPSSHEYNQRPHPESGAHQLDGLDLCRYAAFTGNAGRGHEWNPNPPAATGSFDRHEGAEGLNTIPRPVQFRVLAASYGGDEGESVFQVRHLSLTDYGVTFHGSDVIERHDLTDAQHETLPGDPEILPLRVENTGAVHDRVTVEWMPEGDAEHLRSADVDLDTSPRFENPREKLDLDLAPSEGQIVWVRIQTEIPFLVDPGADVSIPFIVEATSGGTAALKDNVLIDASFQRQAWGNLDLKTLALGDSTDPREPFNASNGQPVDITFVLRNEGRHAIGGPDEPIPVRLVAERLDPEDGSIIDEETVATTHVEGPIEPFEEVNEQTFVNLEWTPPQEGIFHLTGTVNPKTPQDPDQTRLPESTFHDNNITRLAHVGPFELPDLQITDTWLAPFDEGCQPGQETTRATAGHLYCIAATIENKGREGALSPGVSFTRLGETFSEPPLDDRFPDAVFPAGHVATITSSPWQAQQRLGEDPWPFQASVTSDSPMATFANKTTDLTVPVDRYGLKIVDAPDEAVIAPDTQQRIQAVVANTGTAPATPQAHLDKHPATLRVQTQGEDTILPGEQATLEIAFTASASISADTPIPKIHLTTVEDPRVDVPLNLEITLVDLGDLQAHALPLEAPPGTTHLDLELDNTESIHPTTWTAQDAGDPLELVDRDWSHQTHPHERDTATLPVRIQPHTEPGPHNATVTLAADQGPPTQEHPLQVPLMVPPAPSLDAHLPEPIVHAIAGQPAHIPVTVDNTGNVPLDVTLESHTEQGHLFEPKHDVQALSPGATHNATLTVSPNGTQTELGQTHTQWRPTAIEDTWQTGPQLSWTVDYQTPKLRLAETTLAALDPKPGETATVALVIENQASATAEVEILAVVGSTVQGHATATVPGDEALPESITFHVPEDADEATTWIIVRPEGSQLGPTDALLYEVGDAVDHQPGRGEPAGIPMPSLGPFLAALAGALIVRKARWGT